MKALQMRIDAMKFANELQISASVVNDLFSLSTLADDSQLTGWEIGIQGQRLEDSIAELYEKVFSAVEDRHLYRIWHFIPGINDWNCGFENYQVFCRARAEAFHRKFGEDWHKNLPAASAVGTEESEPFLIFLAGENDFVSIENPEQVPAFRYPLKYGPQPPGFVRACKTFWNQRSTVFISGTASIKGSETLHVEDCLRQTETTLHNLELVSRAADLGPDLGKSREAERSFVVYLRRQADFSAVKNLLERRLFVREDHRVYLQADICRSDLLVEIEATIQLPKK